ncbi:TonB-dependent receptor plug domain-containing protein [Maribellus sediminis]|uniref:TonB-dependent receptor plug domain-containing protein n=1 Tax=Maribellus sediminis TaxID=2696285 RepID=UPI001431F498|nr:TonB-dependent receptor [Maribellus sediminis]
MTNKIYPHLLAVLLLIFGAKKLDAQTFSISTDTVQIDEIVVTGTPVRVTRNSVPMAVSVVNRAQIEASDESAILPILNGRVPGLFVTERGVTGFGVAAGSAGQISIRGIGGNPTTGVLMLIDGHPQFMGIMGHPLPDSYVASDVERVEVIRGPASILYGSNAMGGVINIITRKQNKDGVHGNARLSYGSYNTQKYMGSVGLKKDKFSVFASVNHDQTDGHRPHSDFKITNGYLKVGYNFNEHLSASTDFSLAVFDAADPGPDTLNATPGQEIDITRGYWAFTLLNEYEKASGALKLFYSFGEHEITDGFHSTDHNYGVNLYEAFKLFKGNTLTAGFDFMNYGGLAENTLAMQGNGIQFADTTLNEFGLYAFTQQELGKLILNAGLRYQHHSTYGDIWIPSFGFAYGFNKKTTWKGNVSKGFRSPTMRELFMWGPNPNLDPESIWNYETGISKTFFDQLLQAELTLFYVDGDNLIVNVGPPNGYLNTGEVSNKGVELALQAEPTKRLSLEATYSYIDMKTPVFATPEHHFYLNATYRLKKLQLAANIQQIANLDNDPSPAVNNESYTLLNAKAMYQLTKNLKVYVSGENLLDTSYEVNRYYTMPGTTVFAGLNLAF